MFMHFKGNELKKPIKNYTMFDLETTGLDTAIDRIVEIGAIKVREGQIVSEFQTLVDPGIEIPQEVIELHGITNHMVKDAPDILMALDMFNSFVRCDNLVGQNIINFDLPFIWRVFENCFYKKTLCNDYFDMLNLSRKVLPDLESHSMKVLGEMFEVDKINPHRALYDCYRQIAVYEKLRGMWQE